MRISGILALFPLTIITTFIVLQQQTTMEHPFERHAGAYTDVAQIIASIKNAGQQERRPQVRPASIPLRAKIAPIKIASEHGPITVAKLTQAAPSPMKNQVTPVSSNKNEAILEQVLKDQVSSAQAAPIQAGINNNATTAAPTSDATAGAIAQGLMSPQVSQAIAQASGRPAAIHGEHSVQGFTGDEQNAARLDVMVLGADIDHGSKEIDGVDFATLSDENDVVMGERGRFTFEYLLGQERQTLSGTFSAKGYVPTRVDLPLEVGSYGSLIPLMSIKSMDNYLRKQNINAPGGFVLVDLDQEIIDVEIDHRYQRKEYLNADMKVTQADDSARFVLFSGVAPGNVMLRYLASTRDIVERVGLVVADEILYDLPIIEAAQTHSFGLFEMESLSLTPRELTLSSRAIRPFNKKNTAVQDALNYYSLDFAPSILGMRRYTEIDYLGTTFYVGHNGVDKLVVPGQGFLNEVLAFHQLDRLDGECMVQVNLPSDREIMDFHVEGEGSKGPLVLDQSFLNRDGTVSVEATEFSTHAFILGDMQGQIHMRLDYLDGRVDFLNSYCVPKTYLVEQL